MKFNVVGARAVDVATIASAAGSGRTIDCNDDFLAQATDAVRVD